MQQRTVKYNGHVKDFDPSFFSRAKIIFYGLKARL